VTLRRCACLSRLLNASPSKSHPSAAGASTTLLPNPHQGKPRCTTEVGAKSLSTTSLMHGPYSIHDVNASYLAQYFLAPALSLSSAAR
jgi:hypothetical protein